MQIEVAEAVQEKTATTDRRSELKPSSSAPLWRGQRPVSLAKGEAAREENQEATHNARLGEGLSIVIVSVVVSLISRKALVLWIDNLKSSEPCAQPWVTEKYVKRVAGYAEPVTQSHFR